MTTSLRMIGRWGREISTLAGTILLMASSEGVGATIQRQWIKDLRAIADDMEQELATHGKSSNSNQD